jgi:hypothetical protein
MPTITQLQPILQTLFTTRANEVARETGFIQRQRKLSGAQFLQATVFGWLQHGGATRQQLHQSLLLTGVDMSAAGFEQRFTAQAVTFLRAMVNEALPHVFEGEVLEPILGRFQGVYLTDSTRVDDRYYPLKIAARLELQRGALVLSLEDVTTHDNVTAVCEQALPAGALHIGDLGFFDLARFAHWSTTGVHWISRYKIGTRLFTSQGDPLDLLTQLSGRRNTLACSVLVGHSQRILMRLVAHRVSEAVYQKRLQRLRRQASRKQHPLSSRQVLLARWTIYLTSVLDLTFEQVHTLYRARWQIECLFKRWKSLGQLAASATADPGRRACELLAKLLAVLLAHWLSQAYASGFSRLSPYHLFHTLQQYASLISIALFRLPALLPLLDHILSTLHRANSLSCRKTHPNAFQLWEHFDALA